MSCDANGTYRSADHYRAAFSYKQPMANIGQADQFRPCSKIEDTEAQVLAWSCLTCLPNIAENPFMRTHGLSAIASRLRFI